jgi:hypothetical protein
MRRQSNKTIVNLVLVNANTKKILASEGPQIRTENADLTQTELSCPCLSVWRTCQNMTMSYPSVGHFISISQASCSWLDLDDADANLKVSSDRT